MEPVLFRDWREVDVFKRIFNARQRNRTWKGGAQSQAVGRSKGGMTTKILALTDALGDLVRFHLRPGHRFDTIGVAPLIGRRVRRIHRRQGL